MHSVVCCLHDTQHLIWHSLSLSIGLQRHGPSPHVVIKGTIVMIIYVDLQWQMQLTADEREGLVPFWVEVSMHNR